MKFELTPRRMKVLSALAAQPGGEIQDSDGQATALLMVETGHRTTNALSGVLAQLELAGFIVRDVSHGRRTYRIALTPKGWGAMTGHQDLPAEPVAAAEAVLDGSVDLDLLAGVLLKKALLATQAQEEGADVKGLRAALAEAEARIAELEAEAAAARSEAAEQRALAQTLQHNNEVLTGQLDKVRRNPGTPIRDLVSKTELRDLEKLMRSLPSARRGGDA